MRTGRNPFRGLPRAAVPVIAMLAFALGLASPARPRVLTDGEVSLGVGVQGDNNVYLVPDNEEQKPTRDTLLLILPQASLRLSEYRDSLTVDYYGEYLDYREQTGESKWLHRLNANLDFRRWSPFFLMVSERRELIPQNLGQPAENVDNLLNQNTFSAQPGFSWNLDPNNSLELSYREEWLTHPGETGADDSIRRTGRCTVHRRWSPSWENTLTLEGGGAERKLGENYALYHLTLLSRYERSFLRLETGVEWERHAFTGNHEEFWTPRFSLQRALPRDGFLRVSYTGNVSDWYTGDTVRFSEGRMELLLHFPKGSAVRPGIFVQKRAFSLSGEEDRSWGGALDATLMITGWMGLVVRGGWSETVYQGVTWRMDKQLFGEGSVLLHLGEHFVAQAGVTHLQDRSTNESYAYDDDRIWATLTWFSRKLRPGERPETAERFRSESQRARTTANVQ